MKKRIFSPNRRAAAGQQYAIVVGLIAVIAIAAISQLGNGVTGLMTGVSNKLGGTVNGSVSSGGGGGGGGGTIYASCKAILAAGASTGNGVYTIDPDGTGTGNPSFSALCDMTTMGGGWTMFSQNRPVSGTGNTLTVAGAVNTLELNDTTITLPAKLSDTVINLVGPGREYMAKSMADNITGTLITYTDICRLNMIDSYTWNSASNTTPPLSSLEGTSALVCSLNNTLGNLTLIYGGAASTTSWGLAYNFNSNTQYFYYTAETSYTGGACGSAVAGRSWLGTGNFGCNAIKWFTR